MMKELLTTKLRSGLLVLCALTAVFASTAQVYAATMPHEVLEAIKANYPDGLPRYLTPEEQQWLQEHPEIEALEAPAVGPLAAPPAGTVHAPAEYEPLQGVLVAWEGYTPLLTSFVVEVSQSDTNAKAYVVVDTTSEQTSVTTTLTNAGADMNNVAFIVATTDTVWIRDYGPRYILGDNAPAIIDHKYNRTRVNDDAFPTACQNSTVPFPQVEPLYHLGGDTDANSLIHGGGNFHCFSDGNGFSSTLIVEENPTRTQAEIIQLFHDYFNVNLTIYTRLPSTIDATGHIDMWFMPLGNNKVLISQFATGSAGKPMTDAAAADMASRGYTVYRTPAWNSGSTHYTYTNAAIVNNKVFIPWYNNATNDANALAVFQAAMPGYEIIQIDCVAIIPAAGAIHCVMKHVYAPSGVEPPGQASSPNPANGATNVSTTTDLSWTAGSGATSHDVYFGTVSPGTFRGNQTATTYDTNTMATSTTYYWRIDEKNDNGTTTGVVWSFTTAPPPPAQASNPSPATGATNISVTTDLSWTAGTGSPTSRDIYFGTVSPGTFRGNQTATTYDTNTMSNNTTYYWRIDEKNAGGTTTGIVWNFTTVPDTTPPTPNPMTWATVPTATGSTSITMTATTAADNTPPMMYYFECTTDGSKSSSWQTNTTYVATGLTPSTLYSFRVKARDSAAIPNETDWSSTQSATTYPPSPVAGTVTLNTSSDLRTSATFSHTVSAGDNRLLVVSVMIQGAESVSSITYAGSSLAKANDSGVPGNGNSGCRTEHWYLVAPPVGTANVVVTYGGDGANPDGIAAVNFTGVYQSSPIGATVGTNATSGTNVTTNITTLNDSSLIFGAADGHGGDTNPYTPGSGITELWDSETGTSTSADIGLWGGNREALTAGTYTFNTAAAVSDDWAIAAIEIKSASLAPPQYTLTTSTNAGGTVTTPGIGNYNYSSGTNASIVASANVNYHFVNWTGTAVDAGKVASPTSASTTVLMDGDYTVVASFAIDTFTLGYTAGSNGSLTGNTAQVVDYGANGTAVTAVPNTGYHFVKWSDDSTANPRTDTSVTANIAVTASFAIDTFTLNYSAGTNGSLTGNTAQVVDYGANGTAVTAVPATGYHFVKWSDDSTANPRTDTSVTANIAVTASFAIDQMTISGYITELDANIPVESVVVNANNGGSSDTTDANGYYELTVDYGWSGTVGPNKAGYTFEPSSIAYNNVTINQNDNYTAILDTFIISGYVVDSVTLTPLEGVLVSPDNDGGPYTSKYYGGGHDTTDVAGYYEVLVDHNWSGNVVSSKYAYAFEPNSMAYTNVTTDIAETQNYAGTLLTYTITGYIKNSCEVPIEGILVDANNGGNSDTTDANGYYEVWVDYNWSGTVTPSKAHYTFDPNSKTYSDVLEDKMGQDYLADNIYDLDCDGTIGYGDVYMISINWLDDTVGNICDLNADAIVNFKDYAEFADVWTTEYGE